MRMITWALKRFNAVLFELSAHHPVQLAVYRIGFATYLLVSNQLPSVRWIPGVPEDFRNPPPGLTSLLPHPTPAVALAVEVGMLLAVVGLLVGWRTRFMAIAVGCLGVVGGAMVYSFGKIDHNILLWIVPLAMSSSGWGDRLSFDAQGRPRRDTPLSTPAIPFLSILLALAFLTAALPKLAGNWLSLESSATKSYFVDKVLRGETNVSTSFIQRLENGILWEFADWATLFLEFGFAFMILWPLGYRLMVNLAAIFHLTVLFVMNINFESSLVLYLVFALQSLDVDRIEARAEVLSKRRRLVVIGCLIFIVAAAAAQLEGTGLLRSAFSVFGVSEWFVSLATQLVFSAMILQLTVRNLRSSVSPPAGLIRSGRLSPVRLEEPLVRKGS